MSLAVFKVLAIMTLVFFGAIIGAVKFVDWLGSILFGER